MNDDSYKDGQADDPDAAELVDADRGVDVDATDAEAPAFAPVPRPDALIHGAGSFWMCGAGVHALDDPMPFGQENALQRLGKPPFEKSTRSRFRLLGYLATVYEHVSQDVGRQIGNHEAKKARSEEEAAEPTP